jgi:hypothetical protein
VFAVTDTGLEGRVAAAYTILAKSEMNVRRDRQSNASAGLAESIYKG